MATCVINVVTVWTAMFVARQPEIVHGDVLLDGKEICAYNVIKIKKEHVFLLRFLKLCA